MLIRIQFIFTTLLLAVFLIPSTPSIAQNNVPDTVNKKMLRNIILAESGFYIAGMSYLQFIWYKDKEQVDFHYYDDSEGYLQVDKFGHAYGAYIESYVGYQLLRKAGVKRNKALIYGGGLGLILQTPIEVFDGLYEGWGFSWSDMGANAFGSGIVIGQELIFKEQLIKYKWSYWESPYAAQSNGYLGENSIESIFEDYNGHTYWFSMPINRIVPSNKVPDWLCISAGYSANGMFGEFENRTYYKGVTIPETERYRQYVLSLDVDFTKIKTRSKFWNSVFKSMFLIKFPFPALELDSKGDFNVHGIYY